MILHQLKLTASLLIRPKLSWVCSRYVHQTYYDVLKIQPNSSSKEVRNAFINLSKQNHPDKHLNDPSMHDRFVKINEAYSVLINPNTRKEYDRTLIQKRFSEREAAINRNGAYYYQSSYHYKRPEPNPRKTSYHSTSQTRENRQQDFYAYNWEAHSDTKSNHTSTGDSYYGIKGLKKISNSVLVSCLVVFSAVFFFIQVLGIKSHARRTHERDLETSRKNSLLLAMAREKAKLYGNEHQIDILKKSLDKTYEPVKPSPSPSSMPSTSTKKSSPLDSSPINVDANQSAPATQEPVGKACKRCKKTVKPVIAV